MSLHFSLGSFNVRGLNDLQKKSNLAKDMENYKLDVVALQETKIEESFDKKDAFSSGVILC